MKNNKGFSLVELIIVIAIMAVLVGVLAPTYLQYVEKSKKSNDVSSVDSVINACEIGAIDPEVMTDATTKLTITFPANNTVMSIDADDKNGNDVTSSKWEAAVLAAVGNDVKFKSTNWTTDVVVIAERNPADGSVKFTYGGSTPQTFKDYATALTKVKNS